MSTSQATSTYSEPEIVDLVSTLYRILIRLGHFPANDVLWPPPEGHTLDLSQLNGDCHIDAGVLSLMSHLPVPTGVLEGSREVIINEMHPLNYTNPGVLADSRDIDARGPEGEPNLGNALPTVLLLLKGQEYDYPSLVLDIADNTVRVYDFDENEFYSRYGDDNDQPEEADPVTGELKRFYLGRPTQHAPTYLREVIRKYMAGEWIPIDGVGVYAVGTDPWVLDLQRVLIDEYHWPGEDFREEDWGRDCRDVLERVIVEEE